MCQKRLFLLLITAWSLMPLWAQDMGYVEGKLTDSLNGKPLEGVRIQVMGTLISSTSTEKGFYRIGLEPGKAILRYSLEGYVTFQKEIDIQASRIFTVDVTMEESLEAFGLEMVEVGSRNSRTADESTSPIQIISARELRAAGYSELSQALQFLVPAFNSSRQSIADGSDHVDPSTLRGLGPDQMLVLINGKRRHTSALVHVNGTVGRGSVGTDLNAVPLSAVKRVEILLGSGSAMYGSDAVAGVLNIVLNDQTGGTVAELIAGTYDEGDGDHALLELNHGFSFPDGFLNLSLRGYDRDSTDRSGPDPRQQYPEIQPGSADPREAGFDRQNHRFGISSQEHFSVFLNGEKKINDAFTFYGFAGYSLREGESAGFFRRPLDDRNLPAIYPDGFLPLIQPTIEDLSANIGVRWETELWRADLSIGWGRNELEIDLDQTLNPSLGPDSPTQFHNGTMIFDQRIASIDVYRALDLGFYGYTAFGVEFRGEDYQILEGEPDSYRNGGYSDEQGDPYPPGAQVWPGFQPENAVHGERENSAVYFEVGNESFYRTVISAALRFEDYTDFGNRLIGKVATRTQLTEQTALRGGISTGFRAPSLHQAYYNATGTQFIQTDEELQAFQVGTFSNDDPLAQALDIPALQEETSINYSLGLTGKTTNNFTFSIDAYQVEVDDRIVLSGRLSEETPALQQVLNEFGVGAAQFFINAVDTRTRGADLVGAWFSHTQRGRYRISAKLSRMETEIVGSIKTPDSLAGLGAVLFDRIEQERIESAQPKTQGNLAFQLDYGRYGFTSRLNYFGPVKEVPVADSHASDQVFNARWLMDGAFIVKINSSLSIAFGGHNLFDNYPERAMTGNNFNGILPYSRRTVPFGFNGRDLYLQINWYH